MFITSLQTGPFSMDKRPANENNENSKFLQNSTSSCKRQATAAPATIVKRQRTTSSKSSDKTEIKKEETQEKKDRHASKKCKEPGCNRFYRSGSRFCVSHGGGRRCIKDGCTKSAQGSTHLCSAHGGGRRCKYPGCNKGARGRSSFCISHGSLVRQNQENETASFEEQGTQSLVSGVQSFAASPASSGASTPSLASVMYPSTVAEVPLRQHVSLLPSSPDLSHLVTTTSTSARVRGEPHTPLLPSAPLLPTLSQMSLYNQILSTLGGQHVINSLLPQASSSSSSLSSPSSPVSPPSSPASSTPPGGVGQPRLDPLLLRDLLSIGPWLDSDTILRVLEQIRKR